MEQVSYLKNGKVYVFLQIVSDKGFEIEVYNDNPIRDKEFLYNRIDHFFSGGYISRDKNNVINVWTSQGLGMNVNNQLLHQYNKIRKIQRKELEIKLK